MLAPKERKIFCLNNISSVGLEKFRNGYTVTENIDEAAGILVRSADMKDTNFPEGLREIAVRRKESLSSTLPAQTQTVSRNL